MPEMIRRSLWLFALALAGLVAAAAPLELNLRRLVRTEPGQDQWKTVETRAEWAPAGTAVVLCDMWNQHWCKGATARVKEMAPRMNQLVSDLRHRGVLIIHCPSETMKFYEGTPGRKLAQSAPKAVARAPVAGSWSLDPKDEPPLPIDYSDGGCDDVPQCAQGAPWSREIETLEIKQGDAITDSIEAYNLMQQRGITNVMVMGVHEDMCVLGRPFAIRQMVRLGQNVVLVRDLTDSMYNPRRKPFVDHFTGNDLVTWHIEKYWCPTITSDQVIGGQPFRFSGDIKPARVFRDFDRVPAEDGQHK
ncbi:MAG TPA: isochorismatase family protein [Candidatus Binatia bacterium]|jgi:nicotinamidase-related amidase|nr:isochorismatase family protein [Candidatus Binatia bacterium]